MKKILLGGVGVMALIAASQAAIAADMPVKARPAPVPAWSWAGFYLGTHEGLALSRSRFTDPIGPSIFGDNVRSSGYISGVQAGYNWQSGAWVYGIEVDTSLVDARGTGTCLASSGNFNSANCYVKPNWMGTVTGRIGMAVGPNGRTLLYVKGGGAWIQNDISVTNNNPLAGASVTTSTSNTRFGGTVGAGVEYAMTARWSAKLEYDFLGFGSSNVGTPYTVGGLPLTIGVTQGIHVAKIGLNYKIGEGSAPWEAAPSTMFVKAPPPAYVAGWEVEMGARALFTTGRFQKDLPAGGANDKALISRLTYVDRANSGEFFGRIDTPWAIKIFPGQSWTLFAKGNVGAGRINNGHMNDEDWGLAPPTAAVPTAYSNTISDLGKTSINSATADVGLNVLRGPGYKYGWFVGYSHSYEQMAATSCTQIALPASGICSPAILNTPVITETTRWNSLRVGASGEVMLTDKIKLSGDAAWLPYVIYRGQDDHLLRNPPLTFIEEGRGRGVQLEGVLSYYVTPQFSVGAGGRYWAAWTTSGSDTVGGVLSARNDTYKTERYGAFLQAAYKFDGMLPLVARY